jgi:hypothetical protein
MATALFHALRVRFVAVQGHDIRVPLGFILRWMVGAVLFLAFLYDPEYNWNAAQ